MKIKIKQATKKGYIEVGVGGCFSYAFPDSKLRRGRVIDGGRITPTLDTSCEIAVIVKDERDNKESKSRV